MNILYILSFNYSMALQLHVIEYDYFLGKLLFWFLNFTKSLFFFLKLKKKNKKKIKKKSLNFVKSF